MVKFWSKVVKRPIFSSPGSMWKNCPSGCALSRNVKVSSTSAVKLNIVKNTAKNANVSYYVTPTSVINL